MASSKPIRTLTFKDVENEGYQYLLSLLRAYAWKAEHGTTANKAIANDNLKVIKAALPVAREKEHRFYR